MRRIFPRLLAFAVAGLIWLAPARADTVVGPFRCQVEDGMLKVVSAPVRMYRVGPVRRTLPVTTCAAGGGDERCRTLIVHQFEVDCAGTMVPWRAVAARIIARRAANIEMRQGGQLAFQLKGPSFASLNALCKPGAADGIAISNSARHWNLDATCNEFGYVPQRPIVLPPGFAPLAELGGRIIISPETAGRVVPPAPARRDDTGRGQGVGGAPVAVAAAPRQLMAPVTASVLPPRAVVAPPLPEVHQPGTVPAAVVPPAARTQPAATELREPQPVTLNSWSTLVEVVRVGTGEEGSTEARRNAQQSMVATLLTLTLLTSLFSGLGWFAGRRFWRPPDIRKVDPYQVMLRREVVDLAKPDAQMCGELCRSAQGLVGHIHAGVDELRGVAPLRRVLLREVRGMEKFLAATIATQPDDPQEWKRMRLRLQRVVTDLARLKDITEGARRSLSAVTVRRELPRDKDEAYEVLGANPEASDKILKRLVDALRATWHPDHARSEEDRAAREERIKQINVAWDLIQGKGVEA